jgi:hypothetical protein
MMSSMKQLMRTRTGGRRADRRRVRIADPVVVAELAVIADVRRGRTVDPGS